MRRGEATRVMKDRDGETRKRRGSVIARAEHSYVDRCARAEYRLGVILRQHINTINLASAGEYTSAEIARATVKRNTIVSQGRLVTLFF